MATTNSGNTGNRRTASKANKAAEKQEADAAPIGQKLPDPTPVKATQKQESPPQRKRPVTHKDLTLSYMMHGIDGVRSSLAESNDPVGQLDKVISTLTDGDQNTDELETLRDYFNDLVATGQPGRRPVKIGDSREYTVQQQGDEGDFFVRIPVNTLGVQRGQKISAAFSENRIVIDVVMA